MPLGPAYRRYCVGLCAALAVALAASSGYCEAPEPAAVEGAPQTIKPVPAKPPAKPLPKARAKPPVEPPDEPPTRSQPPIDRLAVNNTPPVERLAAIPAMFGDFAFVSAQLDTRPSGPGGLSADLALAGGASRMKIAEDNSPATEDRAFVLYNHFAGALQTTMGGTPQSLPLDRYTFGVEKSLLDHLWSVELRMPLAGQTEFASPGFGMAGGNAGNLQVIVKRMLFVSDEAALSIGLGIDTPTGSDVSGNFGGARFTLHNDAVHLQPFVGLMRRRSERLFWQAFLQLDVPTIGNRVDYAGFEGSPTTLGRFDEQTLLYADFSAGCWLFHNPERDTLTGLAAFLEIHNTTALSNPDSLTTGNRLPGLAFGYRTSHIEIVDLTVGLHAELAESTMCRVGASFPFTNSENRAFDAEVLVQVEQHF